MADVQSDWLNCDKVKDIFLCVWLVRLLTEEKISHRSEKQLHSVEINLFMMNARDYVGVNWSPKLSSLAGMFQLSNMCQLGEEKLFSMSFHVQKTFPLAAKNVSSLFPFCTLGRLYCTILSLN